MSPGAAAIAARSGGRLIIGSPDVAAAMTAERAISWSTRATCGFDHALGELLYLVDMAVVPGLRRPTSLHVTNQVVEVGAYAHEFLEESRTGHLAGSRNAKARSVSGLGTRLWRGRFCR